MDDDRSDQDEQWDEIDANDNQVEFNAEDVNQEQEEEKKEDGVVIVRGHNDDNNSSDDSMGFARRDTNDTLMLEASISKTLDVYHNASQQMSLYETSISKSYTKSNYKSKSKSKWSNTNNDKNKKTSAKTGLLSKISSKLDTYSS